MAVQFKHAAFFFFFSSVAAWLSGAYSQGKPADGLLDLHGVLKVEVGAYGKVKDVVTLFTRQREWSFGCASAAEASQWEQGIQVRARRGHLALLSFVRAETFGGPR